MKEPDTLSVLLSGQTASLASWFAGPLTPQQAEVWLETIRHQVRRAVIEGQDLCAVRLAELVVRYWYGYGIDADYQNMLALRRERREGAMLELCYGQLLIARKNNMAWQHLDSGFQLAAHILRPEEYFVVLKRHELLRLLVLSEHPSAPLRLDELLTEARVIQQLKGPARGAGRPTARSCA